MKRCIYCGADCACQPDPLLGADDGPVVEPDDAVPSNLLDVVLTAYALGGVGGDTLASASAALRGRAA